MKVYFRNMLNIQIYRFLNLKVNQIVFKKFGNIILFNSFLFDIKKNIRCINKLKKKRETRTILIIHEILIQKYKIF